MGDVLTQSQIDALLNSVLTSGNFDDEPADDGGGAAASAGPAAGVGAAEPMGPVGSASALEQEKKYRKYNFHTPKKFTKDRLKLLRSVYENYARLISSQLTSLLRIGCEVELFEIEEQRYYEFNNALGDESLLSFIDVEIEGNTAVEEDPVLMVMTDSVMFAMLDRMLGGTGDADDSGDERSGGYTDIEMAVYSTIIEHLAPIMEDVWSNYLNIKFKYSKIESNPNLIQVISIDEIVLIITFNITVKDTQGQVSICLSGNLLDKLFKFFEQTNQIGNRKRRDSQTGEEKENIIKGIENSILEIKAEFEKSSIKLEDLYSMNVGDVLNLSTSKTSEVNVNIGTKPWFKGRLGIYKDNVAVQLTGIYKQQEINNAGGRDNESRL